MELKLPIYDGDKIVKTYTSETINFSFGIVEDILNALNVEEMKTGDNKEIAVMILKCSKQLKPFLMDLFEGVTAEEIRHTKIQDLILVFRGLYQYATGEIMNATAKN